MRWNDLSLKWIWEYAAIFSVDTEARCNKVRSSDVGLSAVASPE